MADGADLDFDDGASWLPSLRAHLSGFLPAGVERKLTAADPEEPWSARDALGKAVNLHDLYHLTRTWIEARDVSAYHGSQNQEKMAHFLWN